MVDAVFPEEIGRDKEEEGKQGGDAVKEVRFFV